MSLLSIRNEALVFLILSLIFVPIHVLYTAPSEVALGGKVYPPESEFPSLATRLLIALITYLVITALGTILIIYLLRAWRLMSGLIRKTLQYATLYYLSGAVGALIMVIGISAFLKMGRSYSTEIPYGFTYISSTPAAMLFIAFAGYFLLKFIYMICEGKRARKNNSTY